MKLSFVLSAALWLAAVAVEVRAPRIDEPGLSPKLRPKLKPTPTPVSPPPKESCTHYLDFLLTDAL
jgi:hypothetical protein